VFYIFYSLCAISAAGLLFVKNLFKAALLLLVCLLSIAAIYVLMFAEFVAVSQILIYAGGLVVVIIFGIMLTTRMAGVPLKIETSNIFPGVLVAFLMLGILGVSFQTNFQGVVPRPIADDTIRETGMLLMTSYLLPFEVAGILLLTALIGAAIVATSKPAKAP
jgi:NADH-quinone oxidoreductase subunit J